MKLLIKKIFLKLFASALNKTAAFKNIHVGQECYLIGDGASLKWFDLKKFSDKISIPVGFSIFHNDYSSLNAKYALLAEPYWFFPTIRYKKKTILINYIQRLYRKYKKLYKTTNYFVSLTNLPVLSGKNVYYLFYDLPETELVREFKNAGLNPFHGSFRTSILMSIYLGFDTAYLVGFDYTHSPSRNLHWYEHGEGILEDQYKYEANFIKIASKYINLKTVTIEGKSDKLESITYKELTGDNPVFKENSSILSPISLKALATWKGYKIF